MDSLTLQQLQIFITLAEVQSFTGTATQLGLSKSHVSQVITRLEKMLKVDLFQRTTRSVLLTAEGEQLLLRCQGLQQEFERTQALITQLDEVPRGKLRVSCNPYFSDSYLLTTVSEYSKKYPEVKLDMLFEEKMPDMREEQIDIVFGVNWPAPDYVVAKKIARTRYVLCASPRYIKQYGQPKNLYELQNHHLIPHLGRDKSKPLIDLKKPIQIKFLENLASNHAPFLKSCALEGLGIVQLHDYMIKEELDDGRLIEILPEHFFKSIPLYIYYQKNRYIQPKIRHFVQLILSSIDKFMS